MTHCASLIIDKKARRKYGSRSHSGATMLCQLQENKLKEALEDVSLAKSQDNDSKSSPN